MATVFPRPERERLPSFSKRRVHTKSNLQVRSPTSVLLPESPGSSSSASSSLAGSIIYGDQIVECTSFRSQAMGSDRKSSETGFEQVDNYTWFDRPSDLLVEVDGITFHLHKLPVLSRSGLLFRLASQSCDSGKTYINLVDVPGGADAFVVVAKFCYGVVEELSSTNVATIRCAAEYLEMTEALEEGNVISKAEAYLNLVILNSWQESIIVLQSCELLLPWAEDMSLVKRCAESVAAKACTDPQGVQWLYSGIEKNSTMTMAPRNALEASVMRVAPKDWWYEDISHLTIYCFSQVVDAIKGKGIMHPDLLGGALEYYAQRWLPRLVKAEAVSTKVSNNAASTRKYSPRISSPMVTENHSSTKVPTESIAEQSRSRSILEEIVRMLPPHRDAVSCSFLLRATRAAYMLNCNLECKADLEKRAGLQLDEGALSDLLIPCFSHTSESLYDIDVVHRILDNFLTQEQSIAGSPTSCTGDETTQSIHDGPAPVTNGQQLPLNLRVRVAKLLDVYLAETARDSRLPLAKFQSLAEALPEGSRLCDDGLYRAVDTYLKIHPTLSERERKRLCRILNCHRLSLDACTHASQNERLQLRFVVQVLFCEQLKIRSTVTEVSNSVTEDRSNADNGSVNSSREPTAADPQASTNSTSASDTPQEAAVLENLNQLEIRALQKELASMRVRCNDLERAHGSIQDQVGEIARITCRRSSSWSSGAWKRLLRLHLFQNKVETSSTESRQGNPRRWRNSIS